MLVAMVKVVEPVALTVKTTSVFHGLIAFGIPGKRRDLGRSKCRSRN